mgnify:CR=1 FL=1
MKIKNVILLAIIGVLFFVLESLFFVFSNSGIIRLGENAPQFFTAMNVLSLIAWGLIASFFIKLYKSQK